MNDSQAVARILRAHYDHPDGEGSVECVCAGYDGPGDIYDHQADEVLRAIGAALDAARAEAARAWDVAVEERLLRLEDQVSPERYAKAADHVARTFTRERARDVGFGDPHEIVTAIVAELRGQA